MSRFLCVGSWAFGVVAFFGPSFDTVFFRLIFFAVVFVFISTPESRGTVLDSTCCAPPDSRLCV
jgi:hypothetical protein